MKSIIKTLSIAIIILALQPMAQATAYMNKPLVVIRFNDANVRYETSLGMAVGAAVKAKPTVVFDVLAGRNVTAQGSAVANQIARQGISPANITLRVNNNSFNEVMIFVR